MKVQGKYLLSIPLNLTITLYGSDDRKTIFLDEQKESTRCDLLNSVNPYGVLIPKENNIYIKRAKLESTLPGLLPGIGTNFDGIENFAGDISLRLRNPSQPQSYFSVGRLLFFKYNEWYEINDVIKAPEYAIENWRLVAGGKFSDLSNSYVNYQDSNLETFWNGKKGGITLLLDVESAGLVNHNGDWI